MISRKRVPTRANGERGQALVEFMLVALIFFTFMFGIFDMARLFQSWMAVQHASREGARYAITGRESCDGGAGRDACIKIEAKRATSGISGGGPGAADSVVNVTYQAWDFVGTNWTGPTANRSGNQCDVIEVRVTYNHQLTTPLLKVFAPSGIPISGTQRMTNEPYGPCISGDGVD